jgi:membrane fusion protein, multidrug efflux system
MRQLLTIMAVASFAVLVVSCGASSSKDEKGALNDKKIELEKLKKEQDALSQKITGLEKEIEKLDPSAAAKPKLVAVTTIGTDTFSHFIDLQGKIDAENVAMVAPQGQGGVVKAIFVKEGQNVRKGQLVAKLDDAVAQQGLAVAQQGVPGAEANYNLAKSLYEKQQKLWQQGIGSEVLVLQRKAEADGALSQLKSAQAGVAQARAQLDMSNVYAGISGTVNTVNVKVGEFFSAQTAGNPATGIQIVNTGDLKVRVEVPEAYLGKVKTGSVLEVTLPESGNATFTTKVGVVGKLIDPNTRSSYAEGKLPSGKNLRANQLALVRIMDYDVPNAITIPVNTLQTDEKGKFVMVAVKEKDKLIARKKQVFVGELYGDKLEVKSGLATGDVLITDGFQNLYEGQVITTEVK